LSPDFENLAICSKDETLQLWNIAEPSKPQLFWKAKNQPNDELSLAIPIWDTGMVFINPFEMATCTAYGEVRTYDHREGVRSTSNNQVLEIQERGS